jgi:DnaJ-domain-containing protein 1
VLRGIERWGAKELVDAAFRGFEALPAGDSWWDVLGVRPDATKDLVTLAYRRLVKQHHPNASGDPEQFHRIQQAYDQAVAS